MRTARLWPPLDVSTSEGYTLPVYLPPPLLDTYPPPPMNRQMPVKTLPSHKLRLRAVMNNILRSLCGTC